VNGTLVARPDRRTRVAAAAAPGQDRGARIRGLSLGVLGIAAEVDRHTRLVTNDPRIVTWLDRGNVARADLALLSAARLHPHAARQAVQQMRGLAAVGPCNRLDVLRPSPAGLEGPVQDRMSCDVHHRCVALACEGPRLVGLCDVLDLKVSHCGSPQARSLDLLSLAGPFVRVNVAMRALADSGLVISGTTI
jgi:hypothetical protein